MNSFVWNKTLTGKVFGLEKANVYLGSLDEKAWLTFRSTWSVEVAPPTEVFYYFRTCTFDKQFCCCWSYFDVHLIYQLWGDVFPS